MDCWRGVLMHTIFVVSQPTYLTARVLLGTNYLSLTSKTWLAVHAVIWTYLITKVSIPFFQNPLRHLPSPSYQRFPIGHLRFHATPPTEFFSDMFKDTPNDGLIVLWGVFYLSCTVVPTRPELLMEMLNTHNYDWEKPAISKKFLSRTLGEGLVNVEGDMHKSMRRVVAPAFSGHHIRDLTTLFHTKGLAFANAMAREVEKSSEGVLEIMGQMSRVTLDIIGSAGVGKDFNTIENDEDVLADLYATITDTDRGWLILFFWIQIFIPPWIVRRMKGTIHARVAIAQVQLREEARSLMREKRLKLLEKSEQQKDIIATILRSGEFSDDYLVDQLLTFLAAGHDTTATALTWTLLLLSRHPETQDALRAECRANLGTKSESEVNASVFDPSTMPYLAAVCNEVLRLFPTVPLTVRKSAKPTTIGVHRIPPGTTALISMWALNHDPEFWGNDAEEFRPERWLSGPNAANGGATSPYAFLTFLHGPRSCIGRNFALTEMRCLLAVLVTRFKFELAHPDEKVIVGGFVTIKPQNGLRLRIQDLQK